MDSGDNIIIDVLQNFIMFFVGSIFLAEDYIRRQTKFLTEHLVLIFQCSMRRVFEGVDDEVAQQQAVKFISFVMASSCVVPVVMFIMFGLISLVITLGVFLFIEGTLLAFGGLCMVACLAMLILVLSVLVMAAGICYVIVLKLGYVIKNFQPISNILRAISLSIDKGHLLETRHAHQN